MKKLKCDLSCPKCHKTWGRMRYDYEAPVMSSDVTIIGSKKRFKNGDSLACPECKHELSNWDVILAIAESRKAA